MNDYKRIEQLLSYLDKNPRKLSRELGMKTPQRFYDIKAGKCGISKDLVSLITEKFLNINPSWLLCGEGEMLKSDAAGAKDSEPRKSLTSGVPYFDVDFAAGFDVMVNNQTIMPEYLIDFKRYADATCWCNVVGRSMEPELVPGDIIALKKVEDISFLLLHEIYAIVTKNGLRTIKRLDKGHSPDHYMLVATNPEFGDQEIPASMIETVYQVLGCMKRL